MRRARGRSRGQAMVELALLLPVLMLLFLGAWTAANLIDDNDAAAQATRAGGRLATELGNGGYPNETLAACQGGVAKNPCQVDQDIINQVIPIVSPQLTNAKVTEIDIYEPNGCTGTTPFVSGSCPPNNGAYTAGEPIDTYTVTNNVATLSGSAGYTLDLRTQVHPNEAEFGVRLVFTYTSPTLSFFTQTDSQYTVMRLAPTS